MMVNNHPVIYQLIYAIINEENRILAKIIKLKTGITYHKKPKYIIEDERLKNFTSNYDSKKIEFLKNIALI